MSCNLRLKQEREGLRKQNKYNEWMTLTEYRDSLHIIVTFDNGEQVEARWNEFKSGGIRNAYTPTVCGIGFHGKGNYPKTHDKVYEMWAHMLERVYSDTFRARIDNYRDCEIDPKWLNYSTFYEDILEMCPQVYNKKAQYELDKDLLYKGNKVYSKQTCCLLPGELNTMMTQANNIRGELPLGMYLDYHHGKPCYRVQISRLGIGQPYLRKRFKTIEEASQWYREQKKKYFIERADYWRPFLTDRVYEAIQCWEP